jgi:hypothetical protein
MGWHHAHFDDDAGLDPQNHTPTFSNRLRFRDHAEPGGVAIGRIRLGTFHVAGVREEILRWWRRVYGTEIVGVTSLLHLLTVSGVQGSLRQPRACSAAARFPVNHLDSDRSRIIRLTHACSRQLLRPHPAQVRGAVPALCDSRGRVRGARVRSWD